MIGSETLGVPRSLELSVADISPRISCLYTVIWFPDDTLWSSGCHGNYTSLLFTSLKQQLLSIEGLLIVLGVIASCPLKSSKCDSLSWSRLSLTFHILSSYQMRMYHYVAYAGGIIYVIVNGNFIQPKHHETQWNCQPVGLFTRNNYCVFLRAESVVLAKLIVFQAHPTCRGSSIRKGEKQNDTRGGCHHRRVFTK